MPWLFVLLSVFSGPLGHAAIHICQNENSALLLRESAGTLVLEDFVGDPALSAAFASGDVSLPLELAPNGTVTPGPGALPIRTDFVPTAVRLRVGIGVGPMKFDFTWKCAPDDKAKKPRTKATKPGGTDPLGGIGPITPL